MNTRNPYLVIVDEIGKRNSALLRALALARKNAARIELRSFEFDRGLQHAATRGFDLQAYLRGRQAKMDTFAAALRFEGFDVQGKVIWGHPLADKIIWETLALTPELVLKDVARSPDGSRARYSTLDRQLFRECPAPLMLVRAGSHNIPARILAAVDPLDEHGKPHELNERILKTALALAMQAEAELELVHGFEYLPLVVDPEALTGWMPDPNLNEELRQAHAKAFYDLGREYGVPPARLHILDGNPVGRIADFARERHMDLVVMGTVYRGGLERLLVGSVAEGLLENLDCDVLALKPAGFAAHLVEMLEHSTKAA